MNTPAVPDPEHPVWPYCAGMYDKQEGNVSGEEGEWRPDIAAQIVRDHAGMSLRDYYVGKMMQGFCANPSVFASNPMTGWGLVNSTVPQLVEYAREIANEILKAKATP